jgi:MOSC domain-containing protein YiiM
MTMDLKTEGRIASLHLHAEKGALPLVPVQSIQVVAEKGIEGEPRYFGRRGGDGAPSRRQVSLIEREQIAEHAASLGLDVIEPGKVRSNIETTGINLVALLGKEIAIGDAVLYLSIPRDPCHQMDAVCAGLKDLMTENKQGVLAQVIRSGKISVGDRIQVFNPLFCSGQSLPNNAFITP